MMLRSTRLLLAGFGLVTATVLAGCAAEKPYVLSDYTNVESGMVKVCYSPSNSTPKEVWATADEACARFHRTAKLWLTQKGQCNLSTPDVATYFCMAKPGETPIPFSSKRAPLRPNSTDAF